MKSIIAAITLFFATTPARSETIVIPIQDLLFLIPQFDDAPKVDLNNAVNGQGILDNSNKQKKRNNQTERKRREQKMIDLLRGEYPDAKSISIWNGNAVIKI